MTSPAFLEELLFSPRAAFIWDKTSNRVSWMNAAARVRFGDGLPPRLVKALSAADVELGRGRRGLKLTIAGISCYLNFDPLTLAGGSNGIVAKETDGPPKGTRKPLSRLKPGIAPRPLPPAPSSGSRAHIPAPLSEEEMRSLKAVGRTVRRLCREVSGSGPQAPSKALGGRSHPAWHQGLEKSLALAFDLVLLLDQKLVVAQVLEGRPRDFGWTKSGLRGCSAQQFLPQGALDRMTAKLRASGADALRETALLMAGNGSLIPSRLVLGRALPSPALFLGLTSLAVSSRIKRQAEPLPTHETVLKAA